jgi:cytochrome c oxidase subunit 3
MPHPQQPEYAGDQPRFLAHHYETSKQQFDAGRLGMWIFLVTEILFFGGLFCAYAVYRGNHPEIFYAGHKYLDVSLGAINTAVLLISSLTMAWAVRSAQLDHRRALMVLLAATLVCAATFLGIKYAEYKHKWQDGLLWARKYAPTARVAEEEEQAETPHDRQDVAAADNLTPQQKETLARRIGVFFSIYFAMTGLHGLHVIAGMGAIGWLLVRSYKGHFGSQYFGPVDYVGLYWHLVDMIWIYLFPLLYLIH